MGRASKRKQKASEDKGIKQPDFAEEGSSSFLKRYGFFITLFLITITAFLIYSNTFSSPFHFDDTPNIVENYKLRDLSNFWPPSGTRYIGFLSFAINYHFSGLNVFGYHLVNIIIHIINSLLVWWLVVLTFRTPVMERINTNPQLKYFIALTASLIFVSHPIQTQAVTYIVQRFASLSTLFYLLSLTLYIKARLIPLNPPLRKGGMGGFLTFYLASLLSAMLAMKTKEISFTLPFVIILYEFMFFTPHPSLPCTPLSGGKGGGIEGGAIASPSPSSLRGQSPKQSQYPIFVKRLLYLSPFLLTLLIIPLSLIGTDKPVGDMIGELREAAQETEEIPRGVYLLTQFKVIVTYIRLLFLPINQNLDYDYPLSHSLFEPATFLSFLFLVSIFVSAVYLFIRSRKMAKSPSPLAGEGKGDGKSYSLLTSFGILWFFITLSVESSIIPIRDVIFEHRLYLPSIGAIIAFTSGALYGVTYARERLDMKVSLTLATCIVLLATAFPLGIAAYMRNFSWKDEITLWEDVVRKNSDKARGHNNFGQALYNGKRINEAIREFKKAIDLQPDNADAHYNLGLAYRNQNKIEEAIKEYKITLAIASDYAKAHNNIGFIYFNQGQIDEAVERYKEALKIKPDLIDALNNLGAAYATKGLTSEAIEIYKKLLELEPKMSKAHYNVGLVYQNLGHIDKAMESYRKALEIAPDYADAYNNLGNIYYVRGRIDEAIEEYKKAIRFKPYHIDAHFNLGLAYKDKGLKEEALREFKETLKIQPTYEKAHIALKSLSQ